MQSYTPLGSTATTTLKEAILNHENNINALRSANSGTSFPTDNLIEGMHCYRTDEGKEYIYTNGEWKEITGDYVKTADLATAVETKTLTVTGETSVPTPATTNNSTTIANTEFVHGVVNELVNGAPTALDTLQELASALGNDPNFSTTILNKIGEKESNTDAAVEYAAIRSEAAAAYATKSSLATVATSGKYTDLSGTPTTLKNPAAITFTGGVSDTYDGSTAKTVAIPTSLKSPNALTFTGGVTGTYDGSAAKSVAIPVVDTALSSTSTNAVQNKAVNTAITTINTNIAAKADTASPTFTGTVTAPTLTVTTTLNIPGGKVWIE